MGPGARGMRTCHFVGRPPAARKVILLLLPEPQGPGDFGATPEFQERAIALERNAELTSLKGLGRGWRWEDLIRSDRDQLLLFPGPTSDEPCGCYDGNSADELEEAA
ncbi:hypothetical protein D9M71_653300 [compost metagenome]